MVVLQWMQLGERGDLQYYGEWGHNLKFLTSHNTISRYGWRIESKSKWLLTGFYGETETSKRHQT